MDINLAPYLTVPTTFFECVRNKREAHLILEIGRASQRFDAVVATASATRELAVSSEFCRCSSLMPLLLQSSKNSTREELVALNREFASTAVHLDAFAESNNITGAEFSEAGCASLARTKKMVAAIEKLLAARLRCITGTASSEPRWEVTIEEFIAATSEDHEAAHGAKTKERKPRITS